ncbi:hypothetical protein DPMN_071222 [Dreissena polymorpha]|uniref:Uncharacterized protein n=1 Tax=Dreissena polymorpha TaxID=45954 RepID=A0A9D3Z6B2_DREPO|nr:hypothetical protein DPMN_071222 [Dreissena polymorpha]
MDCTFSNPVQDDGINQMSNQSVVQKIQTNESSRLYLENYVKETINLPDKSKEHGQDSNNLSKMELGLDASPDVNVNFARANSIPETLSNKINYTGNQYDVQKVEVHSDKPQPKNGSKDGPVSKICLAESEQNYDDDGRSVGP